jgi:ribosomal-protein-alanine N-acetyltransferase
VTTAADSTTATDRYRLVPTRWWHLTEVTRLEQKIFGADSWTEELFWSELAQGAMRYYLTAEDASTDPPAIVGYAGLAAWAGESWVQTIALDPTRRGSGLGRRLMVALLDEARRREAVTCALEVRADNVVAQRLYESLGFEQIGVRKGYYQPSGADALVLRCTL